MNKRLMLIMSLVFSLLSLVYVVLDYFGYLRCWRLHASTTSEPYIKGYSKLDTMESTSDDTPSTRTLIGVSVCDGTSPKRVLQTVNSLLDQTVKVDMIVVVHPPTFVPTSELKKAARMMPSGVSSRDQTLSAIRTLVQQEGDADARVLNVGGDVTYGKDFVETLLEKALTAPNAIVCWKESPKKGMVVPMSTSCSLGGDKTSDECMNELTVHMPTNYVAYSGNFGK